jgi:RNA recognition motif-containing protein
MAHPVGEESWLAYLEETVRNATDLDQRVTAVQIHKRATVAEPGSLRIWLANCNYFWSLWSSSQNPESGWSEEEQAMGRELFSFGTALDLWQQGYEAIKYRLDDSHLLWDRWISLEMELLDKTRTPEGIRRITQLYRNRLVTPHLTWDDTSQRFSTFLNEYNRAAWEESMKEVTAHAQEAKRLISARDPFELKLKQAQRAGNTDEYKAIMLEYLDWEMIQSKRNNDHPDIGLDLCRGLYARALTGVFATDENIWHEYIVFLSSSHSDLQVPQNLLEVLKRAVQHCPWSGTLWNRYILCAEEAKLAFAEVEAIKHSATSEDQLYKDGMESLIEMYVAWCGYLKRKAISDNAGEESVDIADVGLSAALEDVQVVGERLYGKDFQGDPKFRLERIYIQYLTEKKGAVEQARQLWKKLAGIQCHADSYDFWFRYYMWEMLMFSAGPTVNRSPTPSSAATSFRVPTLATAVLARAVNRRTIDWPERVLEVYRQHCNDYEMPTTVRNSADLAHKANKRIKKRREQEQKDKEIAYAAYYEAQQAEQPAAEVTESPSGPKRKRDDEVDGEPLDTSATKRHKNDETAKEASQGGDNGGAKRDRENATVLVTGLPFEVTQGKLRQYFKDYGHINNVTAFVHEEKTKTSTALIEFSSAEEAQYALLRDGKYLGESQIAVQSGSDLTVYVANFPPAADESFMRELFKDCGDILSIRWPSLRVNTHRRFCYISFCNKEASAKAVAKEGTLLEGKYKLLAKYSDPGRKKNREGAVAEGREVHISNLDRTASESDLRDVFSKYGKVTRVNIPQNMAGKNRGFAFIDFETKEQAEKAAEEMHNTKFRSQILVVEVSKESKVKATARSFNPGRSSASPAPSSSRDQEGDQVMGEAASSKPSYEEISARTIALMGLPDTVNDARVRALVDPVGEVTKMTLQPAHGGAKVEFIDAATAGKAAMKLDGMDFEGRKLRTGPADELRHANAERQPNRAGQRSKPAGRKPAFMPQQTVRRPAIGKPGPKRGLGFAPKKTAPTATGKDDNDVNGQAAPKSNADFKAMFLAGKQEDKAEKGEAQPKKEEQNGL